MRIGALEAGGTKMVCAIGDENGKIYEQISVPTTTPEETYAGGPNSESIFLFFKIVWNL